MVGVLAPVSIALVVGAVLVSEQAGPDVELQLVAPRAARPGDHVALRANLLHRLDAPDGPTLTTGPVDVALVDTRDHVHARARLAVSPAQSMEGALVVPEALPAGQYTLLARGRDASVRARFEVLQDAPRAPPEPREMQPLASFALGPVVRVTPPSIEPSPELPARLEVRVVGGTCVPDLPCTVLVAVGVPLAEVSLLATDSVAVVTRPRAPLSQADIVTLTATVHGPEGETALLVSRDGVELARRSLRLPVAVGELQLDTAPRVLLGGVARVRVLGAARGRPTIVDVFADGRWVYTRAFAASALDTAQVLPGFHFEHSGPYRLQVRTDLFDSQTAASRYVFVARDAQEEPPLDPLVSPDGERRERGIAEREAEFYFASLDGERLATPAPVSGREAAIARAVANRERTRMLSAVALVLLGALLVLMLLIRGLRASREARALLREAGDADAESAQHRGRDTLAVLAIVGAVLLAFLAALAFILARLAANVG